MTPAAFEVHPYTHQFFMSLLARKAKKTASSMSLRIHGVYFEDYFGELSAKTMVVENHYVDQHYLDDFAGYYVGCFNEYERFCIRIHFFDQVFSSENFENLLAGGVTSITEESMQDSYLGFVVVKPLPATIIGRTCLRTYPTGQRQFPITRDYHACLFGIDLTVRSIAFQEQDTVAAACATSALWSAFHCTGSVFHHYIPSPVEITKASKVGSAELTRLLPSKGLSYSELAQGIRAVGLEALIVPSEANQRVLSSTLYAYLKAKIPIVLGVQLLNKKVVGLHAVTVTGFSLEEDFQFEGDDGFRLRSDRMNKLYAHDDQVGPFARMSFDQVEVSDKTILILNTSFGGVGTHVAVPQLMVIPVDKNIRIPFDTICDTVREFNESLTGLRAADLLPLNGSVEWDIYLSSVNDFKRATFSRDDLSRELKTSILLKSLPKFIWVAVAYIGGAPAYELIFDSTDIEQGQLLLLLIPHNNELCQAIGLAIRTVLADADSKAFIEESRFSYIFDQFARVMPDCERVELH